MVTEISIHDLLHKSKFDASLITTYNAYLPFYENVILKRLYAGGCRHNILMMDKSQFAEAMHSSSLRPHLAGFDYTLVPMHGALFHPKIILLASRKQGVLFVGSHNMTISGFGLNKEVTTRVDISNGKNKSGLASARQVWKAITAWADKQKGHLPEELFEPIAAMKNFAPWLGGKSETQQGEPMFLGSKYDGSSLWDEVSKHISGPIRRVTVLGPFFDEQLRFLEVIRDQLKPDEFVIGVEPGTVNIPPSAANFKGGKFVDATLFHQRKNLDSYLHAKVLYIEGPNGNLFVSGSANPSASAWLNDPGKRNIEGIMLHQGENAIEIAEGMDFHELFALPALNSEEWQKIKAVATERVLPERHKRSSKTAIAAIVDGVIALSPEVIAIERICKIELLSANYEVLAEITDPASVIDGNLLSLSEDIKAEVRFVDIVMEKSRNVLLLIHNKGRISSRSISSRQKQFKECLASLGGASPEITQLLQSFEKIVFDEHIDISPKVLRKTNPGTDDEKEEQSLEIETLQMHLNDTKHEKRHRRMIVNGDLAQLLNYLIYQVGKGLDSDAGIATPGPSEEEQVGQDDDEHDIVETVVLNGDDLVRICNSKVRNLTKRMIKQLENAVAEDREEHVSSLMQLIAVISMLRELRRLDLKADWIQGKATLVPEKLRKKFYEDVIKFLFGKTNRLFEKACSELKGDQSVDEMSRLKGLLSWLACDSGYDLHKKKELAETREEQRERLLEYLYLFHVAPLTATDVIAKKEVRESVVSTTRSVLLNNAENWLETHFSWGEEVQDLYFNYQGKPTTTEKKTQVGDLAYHSHPDLSGLSIVLSVCNDKITLTDIEKEQKEVTFLRDKLCILEADFMCENVVNSSRF